MESKTVKDAIRELRSQGLTISVPNACIHINDAVNLLVMMYDTAFVPIDIPIKAKAGELNRIEVLGVSKVFLNDSPYTNYKADTEGITFHDDGDYIVKAFVYPDSVEAEGDEIPVHTAYHQAVVQYVRQQLNPEADDMFQPMAETINQRLSRMKRKSSRMPVRIWR